MDIDDVKVKSLVRRYKEEDGEIENILRDFKKEIEVYAYQFPRLAYRKNLDFCSEFYLYLMERIESVIKNYPIDENILFRTWFNYVLKNQMINFIKYQKKNERAEVCIDDYQEQVSIELYTHDEMSFEDLKKGMEKLDGVDRILIKFHYLPENLTGDDIRKASEYFRLPINEVILIQKNIIVAHYHEVSKIREIAESIGELNPKLVDLKYRLYHSSRENLSLEKKNELLVKISKLENRKFKLVRKLEMQDKEIFNQFSLLFKNIRKARYRINIAKNKLKFEILKIIRIKEG